MLLLTADQSFRGPLTIPGGTANGWTIIGISSGHDFSGCLPSAGTAIVHQVNRRLAQSLHRCRLHKLLCIVAGCQLHIGHAKQLFTQCILQVIRFLFLDGPCYLAIEGVKEWVGVGVELVKAEESHTCQLARFGFCILNEQSQRFFNEGLEMLKRVIFGGGEPKRNKEVEVFWKLDSHLMRFRILDLFID